MPLNLQHLQHAVNATKTEQEHFQSPCEVSGVQNNFKPTRNSESAHRNAPDSVHGGEIRDIKYKTGQSTVCKYIRVPITYQHQAGPWLCDTTGQLAAAANQLNRCRPLATARCVSGAPVGRYRGLQLLWYTLRSGYFILYCTFNDQWRNETWCTRSASPGISS